MAYRTVFEATNTGMSLPWLGLLLAVGVAALVVGALAFKRERKDPTWIVVFVIGGVLLIIVASAALRTQYSDQRSARESLRRADYSVVEGVVTNFVPMPPGGHSIESFDIEGKHFEYPAGWGSVTFNSEHNKGFIRNGVKARITHKDGKILRVEIQ